MLRLTALNLDAPAIAHGFFGRTGGVSSGTFASLNCGLGSGDERRNATENRRRALAELTSDSKAQLVTLHQVHSTEAKTVAAPWDTGHGPKADAMATNLPGLALGILTADCAPVLLADAEAKVIGAAHAGWKGVLAGIIESAIAAMETLGARRSRIAAAIGPCIGFANYEVDGDFRGRFLRVESANARFFAPGERPERWRFDLPGYAAHRLRTAGIRNVETISACTYAREGEFFSYRRATHRGENDYGRQLSAILLQR